MWEWVDTSPPPSSQGEEAKNKKEEIIMQRYVCEVCHYVYDPEKGDPDNGIQPGTDFMDLPDDWVCPICSVGKDMFTEGC